MRRALTVVVAMTLLPTGLAHAKPPPGPKALAGTMVIRFNATPTNDGANWTTQSNNSSFTGRYQLSGKRNTRTGVYELGGTGTETTNFFREDKFAAAGTTDDELFRAKASGTVHLDRGSGNDPTDTLGLGLRLLPGGRFTLDLSGLHGSAAGGVPLEYYIHSMSTQACVDGGVRTGHMTYDNGQYESVVDEPCPNEETSPPVHLGTKHTQRIWGGNLWASIDGADPQVNLCHHTVSLHLDLKICGRYGNGRIKGHLTIGGPDFDFREECLLQPGGESGVALLDDPIGSACVASQPGQPHWPATLKIDWNLKPRGAARAAAR
jgi:hypothetical protein